MKRSITRIYLQLLTNETHVEFQDEVTRIGTQIDLSGLGLAALNDRRAAAAAVEKSLLDRVKASPITPEIKAQDAVRDGIFRGFVKAVQSYTHHFEEAKVQAAERIAVILNSYGNIAAKTLDAESAAVEDLLRELSEGDSAAAVAALNLNDWLAQLDAANNEFRRLMHSRYDEKAQQPIVDMRKARAETDRLYTMFVNQIETYAEINGIEPYQPLAGALNAVIERFKTILAQQKGMRVKS